MTLAWPAASTRAMSEFDPDLEFDSDAAIRIPITDVFDLHSIRPRDVKAVEGYLEEADRLGLRALRIIHGRGIGVQRETVRRILACTPFVIDFRDAPAEAGGWGATIVTLRFAEGDSVENTCPVHEP